MNLSPGFSTSPRFLDPLTTGDGKPYGPWRYKRIVEECFYISHQINTSYSDLMRITPRERSYLLEFLNREADELRKAKEERERSMKQRMEDIRSSRRASMRR